MVGPDYTAPSFPTATVWATTFSREESQSSFSRVDFCTLSEGCPPPSEVYKSLTVIFDVRTLLEGGRGSVGQLLGQSSHFGAKIIAPDMELKKNKK